MQIELNVEKTVTVNQLEGGLYQLVTQESSKIFATSLSLATALAAALGLPEVLGTPPALAAPESPARKRARRSDAGVPRGTRGPRAVAESAAAAPEFSLPV